MPDPNLPMHWQGSIPKQWKENAEKALASPEYMAVRKDALARLANDDGDLEIDAIWTCSTGDLVESMKVRLKAQERGRRRRGPPLRRYRRRRTSSGGSVR